nr:hypothetical protein Iba_chr13dCG9800 [Ipomoea batatas]
MVMGVAGKLMTGRLGRRCKVQNGSRRRSKKKKVSYCLGWPLSHAGVEQRFFEVAFDRFGSRILLHALIPHPAVREEDRDFATLVLAFPLRLRTTVICDGDGDDRIKFFIVGGGGGGHLLLFWSRLFYHALQSWHFGDPGYIIPSRWWALDWCSSYSRASRVSQPVFPYWRLCVSLCAFPLSFLFLPLLRVPVRFRPVRGRSSPRSVSGVPLIFVRHYDLNGCSLQTISPIFFVLFCALAERLRFSLFGSSAPFLLRVVVPDSPFPPHWLLPGFGLVLHRVPTLGVVHVPLKEDTSLTTPFAPSSTLESSDATESLSPLLSSNCMVMKTMVFCLWTFFPLRHRLSVMPMVSFLRVSGLDCILVTVFFLFGLIYIGSGFLTSHLPAAFIALKPHCMHMNALALHGLSLYVSSLSFSPVALACAACAMLS